MIYSLLFTGCRAQWRRQTTGFLGRDSEQVPRTLPKRQSKTIPAAANYKWSICLLSDQVRQQTRKEHRALSLQVRVGLPDRVPERTWAQQFARRQCPLVSVQHSNAIQKTLVGKSADLAGERRQMPKSPNRVYLPEEQCLLPGKSSGEHHHSARRFEPCL